MRLARNGWQLVAFLAVPCIWFCIILARAGETALAVLAGLVALAALAMAFKRRRDRNASDMRRDVHTPGADR